MRQHVISTSLLFMLLFLSGASMQAQSQGHVFEYLDGNQVKARINNSSDMFWDLSCGPSYEVPAGSGKNSAFASSIWLGGVDQSGQLHVSAQTYRQAGTDFSPGAYRSSGSYKDGITYNAGFEVLQILNLSNGKILFTGADFIEMYDPVNGTVVTYVNPNGSVLSRSIELSNGDILVYGNGFVFVNEPVVILNGTTLSLSDTLTLGSHLGGYGATLLNNGDVLFTGLMGCTRVDLVNRVEIATSSMVQGRYGAAMRHRPDGMIFAAGGSTSRFGGGNVLDLTELYDPATDAWTVGPTMSSARDQFPIVELASGEWMLAGGNVNTGTIDHYDPSQGTMSLAATISPRFASFTASVRSNGEVVIATFDQNCPRQNLFVYTPGQNALEDADITGTGGKGTTLSNGDLFVDHGGGSFRQIGLNSLEHVDQPWEKIWKVTQGQIDQFRADQSVGATNFTFYPDIETWPAHGNTVLGELSDQAPYIDVNNDGVYDPLNDGDYPCIKGDQALWWTFTDDAVDNSSSGGDKFGVQVKAMAYAYDCDGPCQTPWLDHTTFYQYTIVNPTSVSYSDVYLGIWMDMDLGNFSDDFIGCDTSLGLAFGYNGDAEDETPVGYGLNPPALGTVFLETPNGGGMTNFIAYENDFSVRGNPEIASHYYGYLQSSWKDGSHLVNNGLDGYLPTQAGPVTNYALSGDPGFCGGPGNSGWTDGNSSFDRRYLQSYGPFDLNPGDELTFEVAAIWARGYYNDNWGSVCELKNAADSIQGWFSAQPICNPSVVNRAEPVLAPEVDIYPNPTQNQVFVDFAEPLKRGMQLQIFDQLGRLVQSENLMSGSSKLTVSTSSLSDGVYLMKFQSEKEGFTHKLVVRH